MRHLGQTIPFRFTPQHPLKLMFVFPKDVLSRSAMAYAQAGILAVFAVAIPVQAQTLREPGPAPESEKKIYNSEQESGDPISAEEALASLELPEGFTAQLFAAEPEVQNPIAACTDSSGRLWVAENYTYAERSVRFDLELGDRVIVLADTDNDGQADERRVFLDGLKVLTGITVARGGVWLMCPPQLLFVPDADGDLVPDGPPEVKLDGFHLGRENYHNFANGLSFGPDSWLYGRCGASSPGDIGLPGATPEQRVPLRGGMWRYHPVTQQFEVLVQGTTNPWGHDWNALGDLFFINTVNGHFWHCIPGAHFVRPHTIDVYPFSYELIDMHADHWHFDTGKSWTASRAGAANDYGGGHAHIGMLIYQEEIWPPSLHGGVFAVNMHGLRVNHESLHRQGSGYVAKHEPDLLVSADKWFRGMDLVPSHDGNVYLLDWSDTGECHEHTGVHRTSGRIFKISYPAGSRSTTTEPLSAQAREIGELVEFQWGDSEWHARKSRNLLAMLAERQPDHEAVLRARSLLRDALESDDLPVTRRLRALWTLNAMDALAREQMVGLLSAPEPELRSWGVRLLVDNWRLDTTQGKRPADVGTVPSEVEIKSLIALAAGEESAAVRLQLASALQRLPHHSRAALAKQLVTHAEDSADHNLPLMIWYGIAPLGEERLAELVDVFELCQLPTTRRLIARRIAVQQSEHPQVYEQLFLSAGRAGGDYAADAVSGTARGLAGWQKAHAPSNWSQVVAAVDSQLASDAQLSQALQNLNVLFGDGRTIDELIAIAKDKRQSLDLRKSALQSLVDSNAPGTFEVCLELLNERFLNRVALGGLARESDPEIGQRILNAYRRFHPSERSVAISTLSSRKAWASQLLTGVEQGKVDAAEISAFQARQIANLADEGLNQQLGKVWGQVRASSEKKRALMEDLKETLTPEVLADSDQRQGRAIFQKSCSSCHQLFGMGGKLGPDLTGAQRANMDYLLQNIVDPSAVVTKEFRATIVLLEDDRVLSGLVTEQTEKVVTLATQNEVFKISRDEIATMKKSEQSTMPEGLLDQLTAEQIRNLFSYLQSSSQVSLP